MQHTRLPHPELGAPRKRSASSPRLESRLQLLVDHPNASAERLKLRSGDICRERHYAAIGAAEEMLGRREGKRAAEPLRHQRRRLDLGAAAADDAQEHVLAAQRLD